MKTKLIMEIGCNHQGETAIAKRMIDDAQALGFWAVKFQKRSMEYFPESFKYMPRNPEKSFGANYLEHRATLEFSAEQMIELRKYCEIKGVVPMVSVFDINAVKEMVLDAGYRHIKLPSQLYSNYAMTRALIGLRKDKDLVIAHSTGMHSLDEIFQWQYFNTFDIIFYCRSIYPCTIQEVAFKKFTEMRRQVIGAFGYSSHDKDGQAVKYAVLLGAEYVERHYTLDKKWKGSDHSTVSSDRPEMERIIAEIKETEEILNDNCGDEKEEMIKRVYRNYY